MRMLCIAAQHDPTGYVSVNRVGLDPEGIARIAGAPVDEVRSLIGELSLNGVFARDQHGVIYNRRMLRDEKKAATARKNGKLGGNPSLCNGYHFSTSDKALDKGSLKAGLKLKPIPIPIKKDSLNGKLRQKRGNQHFVEAGTEQWNAWEPIYQKQHGKPLEPIPHWETKRPGWYFPTEWPLPDEPSNS